jgi:hypothetical protein
VFAAQKLFARPVVAATWHAEAGGLLESRGLRIAGATGCIEEYRRFCSFI